MNTYKKGYIRFIIYKKRGEKTFTGVCLDFGIVIEDKDLEYVKKELETAAIGYLETVCKEKMDEALLNGRANKKYYEIYYKILESEREGSVTKKEKLLDDVTEYDAHISSVNQLMPAGKCYA